jgi:hypothetical protein
MNPVKKPMSRLGDCGSVNSLIKLEAYTAMRSPERWSVIRMSQKNHEVIFEHHSSLGTNSKPDPSSDQ